MLRRVLILSFLLSVAWVCGASQAFAQAPAPRGQAQLPPLETDSRLGPLFIRAVEDLNEQRLQEALVGFENLYRMSPRPTLLYYLGKVALLQQRHSAAADLYRRFLKGSGEEIDADTRAEVQQFLSAQPATDCEVTVQGEAGALLFADGRIAGTLPLDQPLQLPVGVHKLTLEKGRRKVDTQVTLLQRRRAEVRFTLIPPLALLTLTPGVLLLTETEPPSLEPQVAPLLHSTLQSSLSQQNAVLIVPEAQAELARTTKELRGCIDQASCQERLGQQASAQFVLHLSVKAAPASGAAAAPSSPDPLKKGGFRFAAKLLDVEAGMISLQATQSCTDCTLKQALGQIGESVQELLRQANSRPRGTLVVESEPPGAIVQFDGHTLGQTPYRREAFVGPHEVSVSKAGHTGQNVSVHIRENESTQLHLTLSAIDTGPSAAVRARRIAKWALLGGGAALTIVGGTLLGLHRSAADCPPAMPMCSTFDGRSSGIPLLVLGVGALGASEVLFLLDRPTSAAAGGPGGPSGANGAAPAAGADPAPAAQPAVGLTLLGF